MIAKQDQHFSDDMLRDLLDDRLSKEEAERVEEHIAHCDTCREALERLAGHDHWWNETVDVLSESQLGVTDTSARISIDEDNPDQTLDWVRPLLEECPETPNALGRLDGYVVQRVIGQGGMGVVLRGLDLELNRPVAIKILSPHLAGVGAARARFMREAQAAAAVVHPSIVPIYSVVTSTRLPYIVMPCIQGGNLQQRIDQEGPLEIDEVLRIGVQIAEGLAAAHQHGVIHRDIKPANILVEEGNGRVLISDFGLARALDDATLTISGMIAGTPQYMSPEQARGEPIDARSDLYSLGSLLYALATGRPPFRADSALAVLRKICDTNPRPIHHVNERMPAWLDALVSQLMQTQRDGRIATADRAAELLREAHAHVRNPSHNALPRGITSLRWKSTTLRLAVATLMFLIVGGFAVSQWPATDTQGVQAPANANISTDWVDYQWVVELSNVQNELNSLEFQLEQEYTDFPESSFVFPSYPPNLMPQTITDQ
ncbi:MAG: protein kinase [Planctomycetota bacterium]